MFINKVAYETIDSSNDLLFKEEMPPALNRVEEACKSLMDATELLKSDSKSVNGKMRLIEGERGILQGVSTILLKFDESEVRKIIEICKKVLEYLMITGAMEKMEDLINFVKVGFFFYFICVRVLLQLLLFKKKK